MECGGDLALPSGDKLVPNAGVYPTHLLVFTLNTFGFSDPFFRFLETCQDKYPTYSGSSSKTMYLCFHAMVELSPGDLHDFTGDLDAAFTDTETISGNTVFWNWSSLCDMARY